MKKSEEKSLTKTKRKAARNDIKETLISGLKEITAKFGQNSKKLNKEIEKSSTQIAKRLSKKIKISKPVTTKADSKVKPATTGKVIAASPKKAKVSVPKAPVSKKPVIKTVIPKTVTAKTKPAKKVTLMPVAEKAIV